AGDAVSGVMGQFSSELGRLGKERDQRDAELQAFIKQNNMAFWEEQGKTSSKYLSDLKTKQANLVTEMQRLQNLSSDQLLSRPTDASGTDGSVGSEFNQQFSQKSQELIQKRAELAERSKIWRPEHPKLKEIQEDIASLERLLSTIKDQTKDNAQMRVAAIKAEMESLDSSIKDWEQKVMEASTKDSEYQRLKEALARTNDVYEKLVGSIRELDVSKNVDQATVQIMQRAGTPEQVNPGFVKHLLIALFFGLLAGGIVLMIMDRADDRFVSSTEVLEQFNEPILGQIPNVDDSRTMAGLPLLQEEDDRYVFAEAFRSLRSSLLFLPDQRQLKSVIVTSSIPGEGKSTIASNLAVTMALAGTRVLLVDADLRRGDVASLFDIDGRFGLSNILRDEMPWKNVVRTTPYTGLSVISRGPVTNQSSELLLDSKLISLLADWKSAFDLVIFNTSPILATDDTASIAPNFDGTLMVIRAKFTGARLVRNSMNMLYQRQVPVLGLVLNCIDTEMPDYYYYRYPKYYAA
ncbi:MAG: polysaccharide biosynthesis transport protein, partial [Chthoniobacter sp.]|nr:polysaccharide biosynthesis transport protein [Chthoniobacter sp.]